MYQVFCGWFCFETPVLAHAEEIAREYVGTGEQVYIYWVAA